MIESARLKGYDYSLPRHYFVTICTKNKKYYFGQVKDWEMRLSEIGRIAKRFWLGIPKHFPHVIRDEFVIMPNHVHGIIWIDYSLNSCRDGACPVSTRCVSISNIVGSYKSVCTKIINEKFPNTNFSWQSRYYDRIIRNHYELKCTRKYIRENPQNWDQMKNKTENISDEIKKIYLR